MVMASRSQPGLSSLIRSKDIWDIMAGQPGESQARMMWVKPWDSRVAMVGGIALW